MAKRKAKRRGAKPRSRTGLLPNQYKRSGLVRAERWANIGDVEDHGGGIPTHELVVTDSFIVDTERLDNVWHHIVEHLGVRWYIPGKVVDQINRHRASISEEQRRVAAKARFERVAASDQNEAERIRDLAGV